MIRGGDRRAEERGDLRVDPALRLPGGSVHLALPVHNLFERNYYAFYRPRTCRTGKPFARRAHGRLVIHQ